MSKEQELLYYLEQAQNFKSKNDLKSAIKCYENFLKIDNSRASVYNITADLYQKEFGDKSLERQIELYKSAHGLQPDNRLSLHGLAFSYEMLGDNENAKKYYLELLQNNPTENDLFNYGGFLIHCGDFIEGHKYFTHRFYTGDINLKYPSDISKKWDFKTDLKNKTLLIHYEQGFGDTIMYSRFVPFYKNIASKVIFVVQKELYDLISNSEIFNGIEIVTNENDVKYDYNMALIDTPYPLKTTSDNLPYTDKYLDIPDSLVIDYKQKYLLTNKKYRIGISCNGDKNANYNNRDVDIFKLIRLVNYPNIQFYNLQKYEEFQNSNIINLGETFSDFTQSACAIKNMDLIISTDNVILNLSGALGVKTLGIFNKQTNYRWFKVQGSDIGWYKSVIPLQAQYENNYDNLKIDKYIKELTNN